MSEYIVDWSGIGAQLMDLHNSNVPPYLWPKRIREERRREEIVRCRNCKWYDTAGPWCYEPSKVMIDEYGIEICAYVKPDGYCAWGERKVEE